MKKFLFLKGQEEVFHGHITVTRELNVIHREFQLIMKLCFDAIVTRGKKLHTAHHYHVI